MTFQTTRYERRYQQAVEDLLFHSPQVHTHLDWHEAADWLNTLPPARLVWQEHRLLGILASSQVLHGSCWFRIAALETRASALNTMRTLWHDLALELCERGAVRVSALMTSDWIESIARALGFQHDEDIVTLQRTGGSAPLPQTLPVAIRSMTLADIEQITRIDHAAFAPPWQMDRDELRQAYHISAAATVAQQQDSAIIAYQISTTYRDGAHLARLAVAPEAQGQGIGGALLRDAIRRFSRQGISTITVNTQASNQRSLRLYHAHGFRRNGYDLGVWSARLGENRERDTSR